MHAVVLYSRAGCHLCDVARNVVLTVRERSPFGFEEVDIDSDDALLRDYGERIPVVSIDGEEAFEYTVGADELLRLVSL